MKYPFFIIVLFLFSCSSNKETSFSEDPFLEVYSNTDIYFFNPFTLEVFTESGKEFQFKDYEELRRFLAFNTANDICIDPHKFKEGTQRDTIITGWENGNISSWEVWEKDNKGEWGIIESHEN
jgi:hypothetical protein